MESDMLTLLSFASSRFGDSNIKSFKKPPNSNFNGISFFFTVEVAQIEKQLK